MLEFSLSVEAWVAKAKALADTAFQATALDAVGTVKSLTPVRTGYLRANWTVMLNDDAVPVAGRVPDPETVIAELRVGDVLAIVNPVVYAARVEYGFVGEDSLGRHYNQPGRGMMQQTIAKLPEIAQTATDRVIAASADA